MNGWGIDPGEIFYEGPQANRARRRDSATKSDRPRTDSERRLANVIDNETASLRPDPNARSGQPGSAQDLQSARIAIGEVANRVVQAGYPKRVASQVLPSKQATAIGNGFGPAVAAYDGSLAAARAALAGSNTTSGAKQYRLPRADRSASEINGKPIVRHYGPFPDTVKGPGAHQAEPRRIVIAP